ncbi:GNAT family N-acetyltransferase [Pseudoduganella sp. OTU4001]|uniref:GNAT family N-acetyltransferase n=1 Tax=Pseudoduganella sp. OTU4001 TaxID=3043854 RepID=UPI00313F2869
MAAVELVQLAYEDLRGLADSAPAAHLVGAAEGAMPPPHVAARALAQIDAGVPAFWSAPFLMVDKANGAVLGGCTFKGLPSCGEVGIAYGVAMTARGRGIATEAVRQLLVLAGREGVRTVIAEILPANIASSKLVTRLGFAQGESFVDSDGETVVRWTYSIG